MFITFVFEENAKFFAENWQKSLKIVIITSSPGKFVWKEAIFVEFRHDSVLAKPRLAKPRLAKPRLAKPRLAKPWLAKPRLAKPRLAKPWLARWWRNGGRSTGSRFKTTETWSHPEVMDTIAAVLTGVARFFFIQYTKTRENIPNYILQHYQMAIKIPNGCKIFQMTIKYTSIFHSKAFQNLPRLEILVWKQTIWQPWFSPFCHAIDSLIGEFSTGQKSTSQWHFCQFCPIVRI
jgi:hypothetical protein